MKSFCTFVLFIALLICSLTNPNQSQAGLLYFSQNQHDEDNQPVSLPPGSFHGHIHSNDYFHFAYPDSIFGVVTCSQDSFSYGRGMTRDSIYIAQEPIFNLPELPMQRHARALRRAANPWIDDANGLWMTRVWLQGRNGIMIYQYELGMEGPDPYNPGDEWVNPRHLPPQAWGAIFIDGQAEIYGEFAGSATIGTSGNMWLIDNIKYRGTREGTGYIGDNSPEAQRAFPHMLGLVSERNIIIQDNYFNGRENGFGQYHENQTQFHSIIINAGLAALNGSLRIEHTNADWERYQGPSPDERGIIHLTGALVQYEAGLLYCDNHGGTGYRVDFHYDHRFNIRPPPFSPIIHFGGNYYDHATVSYMIICFDATFRRGLSVLPGGEINFLSHYRLLVEGSLEMPYWGSDPITVKWYDEYPGGETATFGVRWGIYPKVRLKHAVFEEGIDVDFDADSIWIDSCSFAGEVRLRGNYVEVTNSHFTEEISLDAHGHVLFSHNLVEACLSVDGNPRSCRIVNNTIVNPDGDGIFLDRYRSVELNSNIVVFCERGIVKDFWNEVGLRYNNVYGCSETDYYDLEPGEGSISADPLFEDMDSSNFNLMWNSPCIDAGDPELPNDPDGTRADIGAYFRHRLGAGYDNETYLPKGLDITVNPNPFNSSTSILFNLPRTSKVSITLTDLTGRRIVSLLEDRLTAGRHRLTWDAKDYPAGVYLCRMEADGFRGTKKMVLIP